MRTAGTNGTAKGATLAAVVLLSVWGTSATAQDLFGISVTGGTTSLVAGGSTLPDLVRDLANTQGQFASLGGQAFTADLRYAGVDNAARFTLDGTGQNATLQFSILGSNAPVRTFSAANGDLGEQLKDYFTGEGIDDLQDFLTEISKQSVVAVTDGNPSSSTARLARFTFERYGMWGDVPWRAREVVDTTATGSGGDPMGAQGEQAVEVVLGDSDPGSFSARFRMDASAGVIDTDTGDGLNVSLDSSLEFRFGRRVGLILAIPMSYHQIEEADVFNVAGHVGVPIALALPEDGRGFGLQVTPWATVGGSASYDFAAGALLTGLGATLVGSYSSGTQAGDWGVALIGQFGTYESQKIEYDGYEFDGGIDQQIVRAGGRFTWHLNDRWSSYGGLAYTDFVDDAAIDNYYTPQIGLLTRGRGGNTNFRIGYEGDFGDGYTSHGVRAAVEFRF